MRVRLTNPARFFNRKMNNRRRVKHISPSFIIILYRYNVYKWSIYTLIRTVNRILVSWRVHSFVKYLACTNGWKKNLFFRSFLESQRVGVWERTVARGVSTICVFSVLTRRICTWTTYIYIYYFNVTVGEWSFGSDVFRVVYGARGVFRNFRVKIYASKE